MTYHSSAPWVTVWTTVVQILQLFAWFFLGNLLLTGTGNKITSFGGCSSCKRFRSLKHTSKHYNSLPWHYIFWNYYMLKVLIVPSHSACRIFKLFTATNFTLKVTYKHLLLPKQNISHPYYFIKYIIIQNFSYISVNSNYI